MEWSAPLTFSFTSKMNPQIKKLLVNVPKQAQRQDDTITQLADMMAIAAHFGLYDALDTLKKVASKAFVNEH